MDVLADRLQLNVGCDNVGIHVLRVRAGVAQPIDALDGVNGREQLAECATVGP